MTAKTRAGSKILSAVHETARDLHSAGFIDMRSMRNYDALCLEEVPKYSWRLYSTPACRLCANGKSATSAPVGRP
jgi:hypothetical protein